MAEAPTQEVERFEVELSSGDCPVATMEPCLDGEYVSLEDHQRLLRAVEEEREEWRGKAERYLCEWRNRHADAEDNRHDRDEAEAVKEMWRLRSLVAESQLEEVAQELERRADQRERNEALLQAQGAGRAKAREYNGGKASAYREAAQLLRDKGSDQGGGGE